MFRMIACLIVPALTLAGGVCRAALLEDEFNGAALGPGWTVELGGSTATAWTYSVSGGKLNVTDIHDSSLNSGWAAVTLHYSLGASYSTFDYGVLFDWGSAGTNAVEQRFALGLYASGNRVAEIAYRDVWTNSSAGLWAVVEGVNTYVGAAGTLPLAGTDGLMTLIRGGDGVIHARWNGSDIFSGLNTTAVDEVRLSFSTYGMSGTYFGSFAIDRVGATPEPATCTLLALGTGCVLVSRRRRGR
jgi:hypothetical protein